MPDESRRRGCLIIIGGGEDKKGDRTILREVARHVRGGKLVIATVASHQPEGYFDDYTRGFEGMDVGELVELYVEDRAKAGDRERSEEHTSELQSQFHLVCRLLLEKKKRYRSCI